ncbi:MAG: hypothetical protein ACFFC1_20600, partial [Promethearchaeota archaeon]
MTQEIRARISYHKYAVFISHLDNEHYLRSKSKNGNQYSSFVKGNNATVLNCAKYFNNLRKNFDEYKNAAQKADPDIDLESLPKFPHHLYNPACFLCFGNTDNLTITTIDDFDFANYLSSRLEIPVKQTCLAFCPNLKSLGIETGRDAQFYDIGDICDGPPITVGQSEPSVHPFLQHRPLLAVSYFKLNGISVLGPGMLLQQAIYKAIANKTEDVYDELLKKTECGKNQKNLFESVISQEDVKSFKAAIVDPQGWSDVVYLSFCRNYSVMISIIAALRCITFLDLFKSLDNNEQQDLQDSIDSFDLHREMKRRLQSQLIEGENEFPQANHIFCSTYTNLGIAQEAFCQKECKENEKYYYTGIVVGETNFNIRAGHIQETIKILKNKKKVNYVKDVDLSDYLWYMVGHNDFSYQQLIGNNRDAEQAVFLADYIQLIKSLNIGISGEESKDF